MSNGTGESSSMDPVGNWEDLEDSTTLESKLKHLNVNAKPFIATQFPPPSLLGNPSNHPSNHPRNPPPPPQPYYQHRFNNHGRGDSRVSSRPHTLPSMSVPPPSINGRSGPSYPFPPPPYGTRPNVTNSQIHPTVSTFNGHTGAGNFVSPFGSDEGGIGDNPPIPLFTAPMPMTAPPEPKLTILKRPSSSPNFHNGLNGPHNNNQSSSLNSLNDNEVHKHKKTLEQREKEYAEARLRILGSASDSDSSSSSNNITGQHKQPQLHHRSQQPPPVEALLSYPKSFQHPPPSILHNNNSTPLVRNPKGPDGTKGFTRRSK